MEVDGVLVPSGTDPDVCEEAVNNLNALVELSGSSVVVSSTWRLGRSVDDLQALLRSWGYRFAVLDKVVDGFDQDRGDAIQGWLDSTGLEIRTFVVVDSNPAMLAPFGKNVVPVKPDVGLHWDDVKVAMHILRLNRIQTLP